MTVFRDAVLLIAGALVVVATLMSEVRTVVLPRGVRVRIGRLVFRTVRRLFELRVGPRAPYERRDRIMALAAPVGLLSMLVAWLTLFFGAYVMMFWALGVRPIRAAVTASGSALLTLGLVHPEPMTATILSFTEAAIGFVTVALLIAYLPSIYGVFSRREAAVEALGVRAGTPPSAVELLERYWRIEFFHELPTLWSRWEDWFVEIAETHTSFPVLAFFRSPEPEHSWVTAAGAILDAASLSVSAIEAPRDPRAEVMIRAGFQALRRIARFFGIPVDLDPRRDDPISITREEFDEACARLARAGVPLKADRELAWRDFAGWRVNYDHALLELARLTIAPTAPWISDRSALPATLRAEAGRARARARR